MSTNVFMYSYSVDSLDEFYAIIRKVRGIFELRCIIDGDSHGVHEGSIHPLWYRGHEKADFCLMPTLFRSLPSDIGNGAYGTEHLQENYRRQLFQARAKHCIKTEPLTQTDWDEIMQHHSMKTRLMDWTESARTALVFSLEAYLDPANNHDTSWRRQTLSPVVWVLDPVRLNARVYRTLIKKSKTNRYELISDALRAHISNTSERIRLMRIIGDELSNNSKYHFRPDIEKPSASTLGLINLSSLDQLCRYTDGDLYNVLSSFELNPFFYLLVRYYCDGVPTALDDQLPPLAIVHPYHSDRIQAQSGAFTCFPYYKMKGLSKLRKDYCSDPRMMEAQSAIDDCLFEIRIVRPERVAAQLIDSGERMSHMYPELDKFSKDLEATKYYI